MTRRLFGFGKPPAKGTVRREFLLQAMRPEGVTFSELKPLFRPGAFRAMIEVLINEKGYDLRQFTGDPNRCGSRGARRVWRLVGKMRWDGSYRSFIHRETGQITDAFREQLRTLKTHSPASSQSAGSGPVVAYHATGPQSLGEGA